MNKNSLFLPFFGLILQSLAWGAQSQQSGNWSSPTTWDTGVVPVAGETVSIRNTHAVTVDDTSAVAGPISIQSGGVLRFSLTADSRLRLFGGDFLVQNGGTVEMGKTGTAIPGAYTAELVLSSGPANSFYRMTVYEGSTFSTRGDDKSPWGLAMEDPSVTNAALTEIRLPSAQSQNWKIGDEVVVAQTERAVSQQNDLRTITAVTDEGAVRRFTLSLPLSYLHRASAPLAIGNLTRNVVVRSAGSPQSDTASYVEIRTTNFSAIQSSFQNIGSNGSSYYDGRTGIFSTGGSVVYLSSSVFRGLPLGYHGNSSYTHQLVEGNIFYANLWGGFTVDGYPTGFGNRTIRGNLAVGNAGSGFHLSQAGDCVFENNHAAGNADAGIGAIGSSRVSLWRNVSVGNLGRGFSLPFPDRHTVMNNEIHDNGGQGVYMDGPNGNNLFAGNRVFGNGGMGMVLAGGVGGTLIDEAVYGNLGGGIEMNADYVFAGLKLGYTPGLVADPNSGSRGLRFISWGGGSVVLYASWINSTDGIPRTSFNKPGTVVYSYGQNGEPGSLRFWGDAALTAPLSLTHAQPTNAVYATPLRIARGTGYEAAIVPSAGASSQGIFLSYGGTSWDVTSSSFGYLGSFSGNVFTHAEFSLTFSGTGSFNPYDRVDFGIIAGSSDGNMQKKLLAGPSDPTFNGGRSRLSVPPGRSLTLQGSPGTPLLVDRNLSTDPSFTLISSGTFAASEVSFLRPDASGLFFSGSGSVSLSSATFSNGTAGGAYITASGLTSSATFYNLAFNAGAAYNIRSIGSDAGLNWTVSGWSGALGGQAFEDDPNRRVRWLDAVPPAASPLGAAPGAVHGRVDLSWSAPGNDGASLSLAPGTYRIFHSTDVSLRDAASPAQAQVVIATVTAPGAPQSFRVDGLPLGAPVYFRLWTLDETPNASVPSDASSLAGHPDPASPALTVTPYQDEVSLTWVSPAGLPMGYLDHYALFYSTQSASGPFTVLDALLPANAVSYLQSGVLPETAYFYQLTAFDTGGKQSLASASAVTPDVSPPAGVADLQADTGVSPGEVILRWSAPADNGGGKVLPLGSRYLIQHAASAGVAWSTAAAQVSRSTGPVGIGAPQEMVLQNMPAGIRYFRLWTLDDFDNVSPDSNVSSASVRENAPTVSLSPFSAAAAFASPRNRPVGMTFSKAMDPVAVEGAFTLTRVKDRLGNGVSDVVGGTFAWDGTGAVMTFTPSAPLAGNSVYEARVQTGAADPQGNALSAPFSTRFRTLMDPTEDNLWMDEDEEVRVWLPRGSVSAEAGIAAAAGDGPAAQAAAQKLVTTAGDPYRRPVSGTLVDLSALDFAGAPLSRFDDFLTVTLTYPDADGDGIVDGTQPPVRAATLSIHWLDETKNAWVRLPSSVDAGNRRISARVNHFTVFALAGQADVDFRGVHAYPTPFKASRGDTRITFTGLPQLGTVKVFTPGGRLVREMAIPEGLGELNWNVLNADGEPVETGVYVYVVSNGKDSVTGKLAVLR